MRPGSGFAVRGRRRVAEVGDEEMPLEFIGDARSCPVRGKRRSRISLIRRIPPLLDRTFETGCESRMAMGSKIGGRGVVAVDSASRPSC